MAEIDRGALLRRVKQRLDVLGLTERKASETAFGNAGGIRNVRLGATKVPGLEWAAKLAEVLDCPPGWLAFGEAGGPAPAGPGPRILGEVQAGSWREVEHYDRPAYADLSLPVDPAYPAEAQYGLVVRGTSINRVAQDGDILTVIDARQIGYRPNDGDLVVVERRRGGGAEVESTAKRYCLLEDGRVELRPDSTDPRHQTAVELATDDGDETVRVEIVGMVTWTHARIARRVPKLVN